MGVAFNCCLMTTEGTIAFVRLSPEEFDRISGEVESFNGATRVSGAQAVNVCFGIEVEGRSFYVVDMLVDGERVREALLEIWKN